MKLLIAEDDPLSQSILRNAATKWGYEVELCQDGNKALEHLQQPDAPLLVILDWMMPGLHGPEVIRRLRECKEHPYVYLILLTSKNDIKDVIAGLEAGADDYVTKPFNLPELEVRVRAGQRIVQLQAELLATQRALEIEATHDGLTGLWNRRAIMEILNKELTRAVRNSNSLAVIMADLDYFKHVNDTYGHTAGDEVLREASRRIASNLRNYDAVGRYGGEEFLLVLPGSYMPNCLDSAERIRNSIEGELVETSVGDVPMTMSLGVAVTKCIETADVAATREILMQCADGALYDSKRGGRNRVSVTEVSLE